MTKPEIKIHLIESHQNFINYIDKLTETDFLFSLNGKWTAGQQMDHIFLSVQILSRALRLPKFFLSYKFGKSNRPTRDYDTVVKKYRDKLQAGGLAPSLFIPPAIPFKQKAQLQAKLKAKVQTLCNQLDKFDEEQLDIYILPHPLLGKLPLREMMYFTIYHVQHHLEITQRNLK
jgi:hypothetical protein